MKSKMRPFAVIRRSALALACLQLIAPSTLLAAPINHNNSVSPPNTSSALNLDLSSTNASLSAALLNVTKTVDIKVGGKLDAIVPGSWLTPAELIAAQQVLSTGRQSIQLTAAGSATGGSFSIASFASSQLGNLLIPKGVRLLDNLALQPSINLSGSLVDYGIISASSNNLAGAFLNALTIANFGTISNTGSITLDSNSGSFTNAGTVTSTKGNITITTGDATNISFNGTGGSLVAGQGSINFRDASYAGSANTTITGGNYLSQSLNLNGGTGNVDMNANTVTGTVNTYAGSAHIGADTANLQMGVFQVSGDPFVWNNGGNLDLGTVISSPLTYLVATASGDIYTSVKGQTINTSAASGNVVLAAGVVASDDNATLATSGNTGNTPLGGNITLTRSSSGGDIVLTSGQTIDGKATQDIAGIQTGGGDVTLIAMSQSAGDTTGGHILLPSAATINTNGGPNGAGDVVAIGEASAGSTNAVAVSLGGINGSQGGTNGTTIESATANLAGATISDANGSLNAGGSFIPTSNAALQTGGVSTGTINVGDSLTLVSQGTVTLGNTTAGDISLTATTVNLPGSPLVQSTVGAIYIAAANNSLTITGTDGGNPSVNAADVLNISAPTPTGTLLFTSSPGKGNVTFSLDAVNGVSITAGQSITVDKLVALQNSNSDGNWVITSPAVALNDGSSISTTNGSSLATLTIDTNFLQLGDGSNGQNVSIHGNGVTIDDQGGLANTGLAIEILDGSTQSISAANGNGLLIDPTGPLAISSDNFNAATLTLDAGAPGGVTITSPVSVTIGRNITVSNSTSVSLWTITTPGLQLDDGAVLNSGAGRLNIDTNVLTLGDGSSNGNQVALVTGNSVFIDDNGGSVFSTTGLTIFGANYTTEVNDTENIVATNGPLSITSVSSNILFNIPANMIGGFNLDGSSVNISAADSVSIVSGAFIENNLSNSPITITTPTLNVADNAMISAINNGNSAALTIHANAVNLGLNSALYGSAITIDDNGGSVFSTTGVTLTLSDGGTVYLYATTGSLSIRSADSIVFTQPVGDNGTFTVDGTSVNIAATNAITLANSVILSSNPNGTVNPNLPITLTAPTVTLSDSAQIYAADNSMGTLTIHTNSLNLGDGSTGNGVFVTGAAITIDDAGLATGGLTITLIPNEASEIESSGNLTIAATNGSLLFTSQNTSQASLLFLDGGLTPGTNAVAISATSSITIDRNVQVSNQTSVGNWTVAAPLITISAGAVLTTNEPSGSAITINTNNLALMDVTTDPINAGGALSISDTGMATPGLKIQIPDSANVDIGGSTIAITAAGSLTITGPGPTTGTTLGLYSNFGINLSSRSQIKIGQNLTLVGFDPFGNPFWNISSPSVTLADGSTVENPNQNMLLAIHTNNLNLGDGSNGSASSVTISADTVTIDDASGFGAGLTITGWSGDSSEISATNGAVTINATASTSASLVFTSSAGTTTTISVDGASVVSGPTTTGMTASQSIIVDNNVVLQSTAASVNPTWSLTADSVVVNNGATVSNSAGALNLSTTATAFGQTLPGNLDLSSTTSNLYLPFGGVAISVGTGSSISAASIAVNGHAIATSLGQNTYYDNTGTATTFTAVPITITPSSGPTTTLNIGPATGITPAEWVAAVQVSAPTPNQTLTIGTNGNATGGNLTLTAANYPSNGVSQIGFSQIVIPTSVTLNAPTTIQTSALIVNSTGTVVPSGTATNITVSAIGTLSGNLTLGGTGTINGNGGTVSVLADPNGGNTINISSIPSTNLKITGPLTMTASTINVGDSAQIASSGTLAVHANVLSLANNSLLEGTSVTVDDVGMAAGSGLQVSVVGNGTGTIQATQATTGTVSITATNIGAGTTDSLVLGNGSSTTLSLEAPGGVNLSASSQISLASGLLITNVAATGAWIITAPTITLGAGCGIAPQQNALTIHTNVLNLGNLTQLAGNSLTVDDAQMAAGAGLAINIAAGGSALLQAFSGAVTINATNTNATTTTDSLTIGNGSASTLTIETDNPTAAAVTITATTAITIGDLQTMGEASVANASISWTIKAPTVTFGDGSALNLTAGAASVTGQTPVLATSTLGASLTIHTNNLNLGDNTNLTQQTIDALSITIDDATMAQPGLKISAPSNFQGSAWNEINSTLGDTTISASQTNDSIEFSGFSIGIDSPTNVNMSASQQISLDTGVNVFNNGTAASWHITSPTVTLGSFSNISVQNGGTAMLAVHTHALVLGNSQSSVPETLLTADILQIDDVGVSPGLTIQLGDRGNEYLVSNSTAISISSNDNLLITSTTPGTSGNLVLWDNSSTGALLTSGGNLTVDSKIGLVCQYGTLTLTLNNAGTLTNNGVVSTVDLSIQGNQALTLAGGNGETQGVFYAGATMGINITAATSLAFADGTSWAFKFTDPTQSLILTSPSLILGAAGATGIVNASLTTNGAPITVQSDLNNSSTIDLSIANATGVTKGTLNLNGGAVNTSSAGLTMAAGTMLASDNSMSVIGNGAMTVASVFAGGGSLNIWNQSATVGNLSILAGSSIESMAGSINIENDNTGGSISIGSNALITNNTAENPQGLAGAVFITIGGAPSQPFVAGTKPANVSVVTSNGGQVFFSTNGITTASPTNKIYANGMPVLFDTGAAPGSAIKLGGGVVIGAPVVSNADLTNPAVMQFIKSEQTAKLLGGSLTVTNGVVTGGTLILTPQTLAPVLTAENIPAKVTVTLSGFSAGSRFYIDLSNGEAVINGTETIASSNPTIFLSSSTPGTVLDIGSAGKLTATGNFTINALGSLELDGALSGTTGLIVDTTPDTRGNASVLVGGVIGAPKATLALNIGGSGVISQPLLSGMLVGSSISLDTDLGGIGSALAQLLIKTPSLSIDTDGTADANINSLSATTLTNTTVGGSLSIVETGNITIAGTVATGADASDFLWITTIGSGNIIYKSGVLDSPSITLTSTTGSVGTTKAQMVTETGNLTAITSGSVFLHNTGDVNVDPNLNNAKTFSLFNIGAIVAGPLEATNLTLTTSFVGSDVPSITLDGSLGVPGGTVSLAAAGPGGIIQNAGVINGAKITLLCGSGGIANGVPQTPLTIGTSTTLSANSTGTVNINAESSVTLMASSGIAFSLSSNGAMVIKGALTSPLVDIGTLGTAPITLSANVGTATSAVNIAMLGSGSITQSSGSVFGSLVSFTTFGGNIGTSRQPIKTTATTILAQTAPTPSIPAPPVGTGTGLVNIANTNTGSSPVTISNGSNSAGNFTFTATGSVNVGAITTNNGSITVQTTSGTLTLNQGDTLSAQSGNVNLVNTNTTSGEIVLGTGSSISTNAFATVPSLGNVNIVIGKLPAPKVNTTPQGNIQGTTVGTGAIFYGTNGITGQFPLNTIDASNKIVTFSTGKLLAPNIEVEGGVSITAIGSTETVDNDDIVVDSALDDAGDDVPQMQCMLP